MPSKPLRNGRSTVPEGLSPSNRQSHRGHSRKRFSPLPGGIDTVSIVFRWEDLADWQTWARKINVSSRRLRTGLFGSVELIGNPARKLRVNQPLPGGIQWGFLPKSQSVWIEGRLAPMLSGDKETKDLLPAPFLRVAALRAAADISEICLDGLDLPTRLFSRASIGLSRLDYAAEISCSPADGLVFLSGFSQISGAAKRKVVVWLSENRVETIYLSEKSQKRRIRIYDKALETGEGAPGSRIRFERELRWEAADRIAIDRADASFLKEKWIQGFEPWFGKDPIGKPNLRVYPLDEAADEIIGKMEAGELDPASGERLLGTLMLNRRRGEGWWKDNQGKTDIAYRRRKDLKDLGITVGAVREQIDLSEGLKAAGESLFEPQLFSGLVPPRIKKTQSKVDDFPFPEDWEDEDGWEDEEPTLRDAA